MDSIKIKVPAGTTKKKKCVGRGNGSGHGKTSCRGHKGQKARSGGSIRPGFEGGQMPLYRRIARRGFSNHMFKKQFNIVNLSDLVDFDEGAVITKEFLDQHGKIKKAALPVKLLGNGEVAKKFTIQLDKVSKAAQEKIEKSGGQIVTETKNEVKNNG